MAGINPDTIPRYAQPMDPVPERRCGDCAFCKEAGSDRLACVWEVVSPSHVDDGELTVVEAEWQACSHWRLSAWA